MQTIFVHSFSSCVALLYIQVCLYFHVSANTFGNSSVPTSGCLAKVLHPIVFPSVVSASRSSKYRPWKAIASEFNSYQQLTNKPLLCRLHGSPLNLQFKGNRALHLHHQCRNIRYTHYCDCTSTVNYLLSVLAENQRNLPDLEPLALTQKMISVILTAHCSMKYTLSNKANWKDEAERTPAGAITRICCVSTAPGLTFGFDIGSI